MYLLIALLLSAAPPTDVTGLAHLSPEAIRRYAAGLDPRSKIALQHEIWRRGVNYNLTDQQIWATQEGIGPDDMLLAARGCLAAGNCYEALLLKQERKDGKYNAVPDRIQIRVCESPRRLWMRWLPGGRHAGQEAIFDASRDPLHLRVHGGGILNVINLTIGLDGAFAKEDTEHHVTELSFGGLFEKIEADRVQLRKEGRPIDPVIHRSTVFKGRRYWEMLYKTPPGPPLYYSWETRFLFDLDSGMPRVTEVYDRDMKIRERYEFETLRWEPSPKGWFDEKNPEYKF